MLPAVVKQPLAQHLERVTKIHQRDLAGGGPGRVDQTSELPDVPSHLIATHLLEGGYNIQTVQELLGHRDKKTTMVYTHVLNQGPKGVWSPLDEV